MCRIVKRKSSCFDLARDVIEVVNAKNVNNQKKIELFNSLAALLGQGWCSFDILNAVSKNTSRVSQSKPSWGLFQAFSNAEKTMTNLLHPSSFYHHNELRIVPGPIIVDWDYNTGAFTKKIDDYFLEMRDSFTVEDLADYFFSKSKMYDKSLNINSKRIRGSFSWLVKNYDIEILLYMIDVANDKITFLNLRQMQSPMDLQEYFIEARELLSRRRTECKINGDDKVVPRKFSDRGRALGR